MLPCVGDTIETQGGAVAGVMARARSVRSGWSTFRELLPLLTSRSLLLLSKGRVYQAYVHSVMYGSETWPVRVEDVCCMEKNDYENNAVDVQCMH